MRRRGPTTSGGTPSPTRFRSITQARRKLTPPQQVDEINALPPLAGRAAAPAWWSAMAALATHCLTAPRPDPTSLLEKVGEANQKMLARDVKDQMIYEAWFAEAAMAFASVAVERGFRVPGVDPHPSMPLGLLALAPSAVPSRPKESSPAARSRSPESIERAAKGQIPRGAPSAE